ncbi:MAG: hypothetical protein PHU80_09705 [Kiritimatiellae bacterium]|nr:hypothetical protein [Kiritimatiellia bacterium]
MRLLSVSFRDNERVAPRQRGPDRRRILPGTAGFSFAKATADKRLCPLIEMQ